MTSPIPTVTDTTIVQQQASQSVPGALPEVAVPVIQYIDRIVEKPVEIIKYVEVRIPVIQIRRRSTLLTYFALIVIALQFVAILAIH